MHPEAGSVPVQEFEQIARAIDEDKNRPTAGIVAKAMKHFGVKTIERLAHVTGFKREKNTQAAGEGQHGWRRVWMSSATRGRTARDDISSAVPQGRTTRRAGAADEGDGGSITSANAAVSGGRVSPLRRRFRSQEMKV